MASTSPRRLDHADYARTVSKTKRQAAQTLDRSLQPSKPADHDLDGASVLDGDDEPEFTFTEVSYTKLLTIPLQWLAEQQRHSAGQNVKSLIVVRNALSPLGWSNMLPQKPSHQIR